MKLAISEGLTDKLVTQIKRGNPGNSRIRITHTLNDLLEDLAHSMEKLTNEEIETLFQNIQKETV